MNKYRYFIIASLFLSGCSGIEKNVNNVDSDISENFRLGYDCICLPSSDDSDLNGKVTHTPTFGCVANPWEFECDGRRVCGKLGSCELPDYEKIISHAVVRKVIGNSDACGLESYGASIGYYTPVPTVIGMRFSSLHYKNRGQCNDGYSFALSLVQSKDKNNRIPKDTVMFHKYFIRWEPVEGTDVSFCVGSGEQEIPINFIEYNSTEINPENINYTKPIGAKLNGVGIGCKLTIWGIKRTRLRDRLKNKKSLWIGMKGDPLHCDHQPKSSTSGNLNGHYFDIGSNIYEVGARKKRELTFNKLDLTSRCSFGVTTDKPSIFPDFKE